MYKYFVPSIVLVLQGCAPTPPSAPSCADPKTTNLVTQIFRDSFQEKVTSQKNQIPADKMLSVVKIEVKQITTSAHEEKINKYECDGTLEITLPAPLNELLAKAGYEKIRVNESVQIKEAVVTDLVHFTSAVAEDTKQHLVTLRNHMELVRIVALLGTEGAFSTKADFLAELSKFLGRPAKEILTNKLIAQQFEGIVKNASNVFEFSLNESSTLGLKGEYFFGSGRGMLMPEEKPIGSAAFVVNKSSGDIYVAMKNENTSSSGVGKITLYGVTSPKDLPSPLHEWFIAQGGIE